MIELEQVHFSYGETGIEVLRAVNLRIERGECVILTGGSGSGKTTITRLINGLIPTFYSGHLSGSVKIDGEDMQGKQPHELAKKVGSVFQNPRTQFFNTDTDSELVFAMENCGISPAEMGRRYDETVRNLELSELCGRDIFSLSGGEKQRIAFGSVYALSPDIYVLDEPSANLDRESIDRLKYILRKLKEEGKTLLISEHRLYYLAEIADRLVYLREGRVESVFSIKDLLLKNEVAVHELGLRSLWDSPLSNFPPSCPVHIPALELRSLSVKRGKRRVLRGLSLLADYGVVTGITGANGIGKTTLARTICGLLKEEGGSLYFDGCLLETKERKKHTFLVMQDPNYQLFSDSLLGEFELNVFNSVPKEEEVQEVLTALDLLKLCDRHPLSLSGGQKQRLCIALAALSGADILLFDEPTSGLDYRNMCGVAHRLKELARRKKAVIVISHDFEFLNLVCTNVIDLSR